MITTIAFDADDTLWENERYFKLTEAKFAELLTDYISADQLSQCLLETERRNLARFGYGAKGFVLSLIETAIEVTDRQVSANIIEQIMQLGFEISEQPVHILPNVSETLNKLSTKFRLLLITKGDLIDQERKISLSGLAHLFSAIEIVSEKTKDTYLRIFNDIADGPEKSVMVGNSLRSDVIPAIEAGSWGIHIPHNHSWELESATIPNNQQKFRQINGFSSLQNQIKEIQNGPC